MKVKLECSVFHLVTLAILAFSLSSCSFTSWGHASGIYFDESGLPEQDSDNSYMAGWIGPGRGIIKLNEKPLIKVFANCDKDRIITFSPSILVHLPPIIPAFFFGNSDDWLYGEKLEISFSIHESKMNYSFDPGEAVLVLEKKKLIKPANVKEKTEIYEERSSDSGKTIKKKYQWYELYFDIKCEDLENLKEGRLLLVGFKYQGRPLDLEGKFYWDSGFYLAWGFLKS